MTDDSQYRTPPTQGLATPLAEASGLEDATHPIFVWDQDVDGFVWANQAGLDRWGALSLTSFRTSRLDRAMPAMVKLKALSMTALPVEGVTQTLTFWTPRGAYRMTCRCRPVDLLDGGHGLVLESLTATQCAEDAPPFAQTGGTGRSAYLPNGAVARHNGLLPGNPTPKRVAGYLNGGPEDAVEINAGVEANTSQPGRSMGSQTMPSPSEDDHLAMQEIARMLGRPGKQSDHEPHKSPAPGHSGSPVVADQPNASPTSSGAHLRQPLPPVNEPQSEKGRFDDAEAESTGPLDPATRIDTLNHELRTPLNSIIGFAEMMHREQLGPIGTARYKEYAGDILESARHALSLINDLLDSSRLRAGHLDIRPEELDLPDLLDRVIALMAPQAQTASVSVVPGYPTTLPPLIADSRALRQILLNILTNALKFTPAGGHVFISARHDDACHTIDVRDTGIGMSEDQIADAQKPWVRNNGGDAPPAAPIGSGLGLPLVQALTRALGGTLSLTSAPGEGTCVTIRLPASGPQTMSDA